MYIWEGGGGEEETRKRIIHSIHVCECVSAECVYVCVYASPHVRCVLVCDIVCIPQWFLLRHP